MSLLPNLQTMGGELPQAACYQGYKDRSFGSATM